MEAFPDLEIQVWSLVEKGVDPLQHLCVSMIIFCHIKGRSHSGAFEELEIQVWSLVGKGDDPLQRPCARMIILSNQGSERPGPFFSQPPRRCHSRDSTTLPLLLAWLGSWNHLDESHAH